MALRPAAAHAVLLAGSLMRRPRHALFMVLCLAMGAALHAQPVATAAAEIRLYQGMYVCVVIAVAALFYWAILSVHFSVAHAEGQPAVVPGAYRSATEAPTRYASRRPLQHFPVLCMITGALLHAEPLMNAAAGLHVHRGVVAGFVLAAAALFYWAIQSIHFSVAHAEGKPAVVPGVDRTVEEEAPTSSPSSGRPLQRFVVLCLTTGVLLHAEPLMNAAAGLHVHPGVVAGVVLAVTTLFNWELLSLNFHVARRAAEREHKDTRRPAAPAASAGRSPHLARLCFLFLAALMSVSWFVEPLVGAAGLWLSKTVIILLVLSFAAVFNLSVHMFRSFFLPEPPSASAAAAQGQGVGASTAGAIGICIATAACVVGASASAYHMFAPARS